MSRSPLRFPNADELPTDAAAVTREAGFKTLSIGFQVERIGASGEGTSLHDFLRAAWVWFAAPPAAVGHESSPQPERFFLSEIYPNPFNGRFRVDFGLSRQNPVRLSLYDPAGREIIILSRGSLPAGRHSHIVDMRSLEIGTGLYFVRLESVEGRLTRRALYLR
ncbi:MAG: T9SS type A sorting domain-containing protein [Calditrichaeota bacterium]|nr:T9SS type A sorting domain-containing protein [Calditrichota bacterium]